VFFNRLGELRDRTLENQQHRASGLNSGRGRNRSLEHGLPGAGCSSLAQPRADDPGGVTRSFLTVEMGTHQLDRRLPLAPRWRPAKSEIATTPDRPCVARDPSLACNFLRTGHGPHLFRSFLLKRFLQFFLQFGYAHLVEGDTIFVIVEPFGPRISEP
jgi:hypothetical protein